MSELEESKIYWEKFYAQLNAVMNSIGFSKIDKEDVGVTYYKGIDYPDIIIAYETLWSRFGVYVNNEFKEQLFLWCIEEKRIFIEWLKFPKPKGTLEIGADKVLNYIKQNNFFKK